MKAGAVVDTDYVVVPKGVWSLFDKWFGIAAGSPLFIWEALHGADGEPTGEKGPVLVKTCVPFTGCPLARWFAPLRGHC